MKLKAYIYMGYCTVYYILISSQLSDRSVTSRQATSMVLVTAHTVTDYCTAYSTQFCNKRYCKDGNIFLYEYAL